MNLFLFFKKVIRFFNALFRDEIERKTPSAKPVVNRYVPPDKPLYKEHEISRIPTPTNIILAKCMENCRAYHNEYLYENHMFSFYDTDEEFVATAKRRGITFERRVGKEIRRHMNRDHLALEYQWNLNGGICDFVLFWKDIKNRWRGVLIECKHSDSRDIAWMEQQIEDGIAQLKRYKRLADNKYKQRFDLLVLLVDFPVVNGRAVTVLNDVVILNFQLLFEFIQGVNDWCEFTKKNDS